VPRRAAVRRRRARRARGRLRRNVWTSKPPLRKTEEAVGALPKNTRRSKSASLDCSPEGASSETPALSTVKVLIEHIVRVSIGSHKLAYPVLFQADNHR